MEMHPSVGVFSLTKYCLVFLKTCKEFIIKIFIPFALSGNSMLWFTEVFNEWNYLLDKILILEVLWIVKIDVRLSKLSCNNLDCYQFSFEIRIWYTLMILSSFKWNPEHELFSVILNEFLYERLTNWFFNAANRICLRFLVYVINFISLEFCLLGMEYPDP